MSTGDPDPEETTTMANKLYFDVLLASATTNRSFLCTQFTAGSVGDRFGNLLKPLEACVDGVTPIGIQAAREVSAWFETTQISGQNATTALDCDFRVRFVQPTANGVNHTLTSLRGNGTFENTAGSSAVFGTAGTLRNFSVQISKVKPAGGTVSVNGVLYVQRQHSIEV